MDRLLPLRSTPQEGRFRTKPRTRCRCGVPVWERALAVVWLAGAVEVLQQWEEQSVRAWRFGAQVQVQVRWLQGVLRQRMLLESGR